MKAKRIAEITANIVELKKQHSEEGAASMMAQAIITSKITMLNAELSVVISTPEKKKLSNDPLIATIRIDRGQDV